MREWILAVLLALAAGAVVKGVSHYSTGAAWVVFGLLLGVWAWLVVTE